MADVVTLAEFAECCRVCDPVKAPEQAAALLKEAARIAIYADKLKHSIAEQQRTNKEQLTQQAEIIQKALTLSEKIISAAEVIPEQVKRPKKKAAEKPKQERTKYGEYKHVLLTAAEYDKLVTDFGADQTAEGIKRVDEYCEQVGKTYKNYYLTCKNFITGRNSKETKTSCGEHSYDINKILEHAQNAPLKVSEHSYDLNKFLEHAQNTTPKIKEG